MLRRSWLLLVPLVALTACAGEGSATPPEGPADLTVVALPDYRFDQPTYSAAAGETVVELRNDDEMSHSVVIVDPAGEAVGGFRLLVPGGRSARGTVELDPGTYQIVCDVPGHLQQGQVAGLTVA